MAESVDELPVFGAKLWLTIFDGGKYVLKRGREYNVDERLMADRVRSAARRKGYAAEVCYSREIGVVTVQPKSVG